MNLFSLDPENLAYLSKYAIAFAGLVLAGLTVASLFWEETASARKEERDAKYRHETELALADSAARIKEAEANAAAANERSKALELQLSEQRESTAKAEKELLELQQRFSPRRISAAQEVTLLAALSAFSGQPLDINFITGVPEIDTYSSDLERVFKKAGLAVRRIPSQVYGGTNTGHSMIVGTNRVDLANAIVQGLLDAGLVAPRSVGKGEDKGNPDALILWVWPKE